jgi:hypothetical protein
VITRALRPFPEARQAVVQALRELDAGKRALMIEAPPNSEAT